MEELPRLGEGSSTEGGQPSAELTAVLREAEKEAGELSDEYVSTEHLLLALAANRAAPAKRCARSAPAASGCCRRSPRCAARTA